jgi:integrase
VPIHTELSDLKCRKAEPQPKPYRIADTGGLYLLVQPSGGKLWRWKYYFAKKEKLMALGKYPDIGLAQARVLHAAARAQLASGIDPMAARKEKKAASAAQHAKEESVAQDTFAHLARQWFAWWKTDKASRYADAVERRMETDMIPAFGTKKPEDITRRDIIDATQAVDLRGAREIAQRNLQFLSLIFEWGINNGYLNGDFRSPTAGIRPHLILKKVPSNSIAYLEIDEVPELLVKMREYGGQQLTKLAMELLSLTFVRTSDLIDGRWEEIKWKEKQWQIPLARMKMKRRFCKTNDFHIVPLSRQALKVLKELEQVSGKREHLFPDFSEGMGTMSNNTILQALKRMGYKGRMTGHGWRSVASTYLNNHGYSELWVEAQLAHVKDDKVAGAYNHALYLEQRRDMMQAWADALDEMRASAMSEQRAA